MNTMKNISKKKQRNICNLNTYTDNKKNKQQKKFLNNSMEVI